MANCARWVFSEKCLAVLCFWALMAGCEQQTSSPPLVKTGGSTVTNDPAIEQPVGKLEDPSPPDEDFAQDDEPAYPPIEEHFEIPANWKRLGKFEIWVDREKHLVVVGGHICLIRGPLEMFACPEHSKEHESVVAVHERPKFIHAALLSVGAKPGTPVRFDPEYKAATGPKVKITVRWMENGKLRELPAQQMVRNIETQEPMTHDWLFVGSEVWKDPDTGEEVYFGDSGEFICVSNFGSATMDVPVESTSAAASGLMFEALTDNIPDPGTLVLLVLEPEVASSDTPLAGDAKESSREQSEPPAAKIDK